MGVCTHHRPPVKQKSYVEKIARSPAERGILSRLWLSFFFGPESQHQHRFKSHRQCRSPNWKVHLPVLLLAGHGPSSCLQGKVGAQQPKLLTPLWEQNGTDRPRRARDWEVEETLYVS